MPIYAYTLLVCQKDMMIWYHNDWLHMPIISHHIRIIFQAYPHHIPWCVDYVPHVSPIDLTAGCTSKLCKLCHAIIWVCLKMRLWTTGKSVDSLFSDKPISNIHLPWIQYVTSYPSISNIYATKDVMMNISNMMSTEHLFSLRHWHPIDTTYLFWFGLVYWKNLQRRCRGQAWVADWLGDTLWNTFT
jgi:hypothetical protein